MLLSSEMYFDVHYDYTTSLRHPWYLSGFVFFREEKRNTKNMKKVELCSRVLFPSTVHIQYVQKTLASSLVRLRIRTPSRSLVISLHIYVQFRNITVKHCHDVWLFRLPQLCRKIYIELRSHSAPVCLCISNVASFTLPCYVITPCTGCQFKYWSYQKETYLTIRA